MTAAATLLATDAPEQVSVADIAKRAGLTSAAIYYHFRSRDELVDEIVSVFAEEWSKVVTQSLAEIQDLGGLTSFIETNFDWVESHGNRAMVYFVSSIGTTLASENVRRETRYALTRAASGAVQRLGSETSTVDGTVRALGLVTLLEVGAADILRPVSSYTDLGEVKFRKTMATIAQKLLT